MRFLADIPDDDIQWLDALAAGQGASAADVRVPRYEIREAAAPLATPPRS